MTLFFFAVASCGSVNPYCNKLALKTQNATATADFVKKQGNIFRAEKLAHDFDALGCIQACCICITFVQCLFFSGIMIYYHCRLAVNGKITLKIVYRLLQMTEADRKSFNKELLALAVPLALQNLLNALVGASDALMLGRLNQDSIAAVFLANQVSFVMSLFNSAIIGVATVLITQYWGKRDYANARRFLSMSLRYVAGISFVFFLIAFCIPRHLMSIFTSEKELIRIGAEYLQIVSFSYLFAGLSQCFLVVMKVSGAAKLSVIISAVILGVDMLVDFFLIYGIGGLPALGANGSAYSTVAVEMIALIWCIVWSRGKENTRMDRDALFFFSKQYEIDAWKLVPGMFASCLSWGLSTTMHSFILGHLGTDATAAASVTSVVQQLILCFTMGLSRGAGSMIAKLLGDNRFDKAKEYGSRFWKISFLCGLLNVCLIAAVTPLVYVFYVLEPQAKVYLVQMLAFSALYMYAGAFNTIITCGVFPAGGDPKYDAISSFFATWCFAIPLALICGFALHLPVMAVYIIMCLDEIVKLPFIFGRYKKYIWLKNLTRAN